MKESIYKTRDRDEYFPEEGCYIREIWNTPEDGAASIARARVRPGDVTAWHLLKNIVERYVVMEGTGRVEVGDLPPAEVGVGDVVVIPRNTRQRIANTGDKDLIFLCICTPCFIQEDYESLG